MNLKARFSDGKVLTLNELDHSTSYQALLSRLCTFRKWTKEPRVLLAGHPPSLISALPQQPLSEIMSSGTMLLIEPHNDETPIPGNSSKSRRGRISRQCASGRGRASTLTNKRKIAFSGGRALGGSASEKVVTLSDIHQSSNTKRRRVAQNSGDGEQSDADWAPTFDVDADDEDDQNEKDLSSGRKRNQSSSVNGRKPDPNYSNASVVEHQICHERHTTHANEPGPISNDGEVALTWTDTGTGDMAAIAMEFGLPVAQGYLGTIMAASVFDINGERDNPISRELQANFSGALEKRRAEAEGERRLSAYLSKRYEIRRKEGGVKFTVRYRGTNERSWTKENNGEGFLSWPKVLLSAVLKEVVENSQDRMRLLPLDMAAVSPRMFWNLVRLFPENLEDGMRELVPGADWSFLTNRKCTLSEKGLRSLQNKEMNWESE